MTTAMLDTSPGGLARWLEEREGARLGVPIERARKSLARRTGIAAGTFESLRKGRLKGVRDYIVERLTRAAIEALNADIERDAHALETLRRMARQGGRASCQAEVARLVASMKRAQALIDEGRGE